MNREIKFKGKTLIGNKVVTGYYRRIKVGFNEIDCIYTPDSDMFYFIYPDSLGQFTGKHDRNNIEIYEGDFIDAIDRIVRVTWNVNCLCFDTEFVKYKGDLMSNGITIREWSTRATIIDYIPEE